MGIILFAIEYKSNSVIQISKAQENPTKFDQYSEKTEPIIEKTKATQSIKYEKKGFLAKIEESKNEDQPHQSEQSADNSSSSLPIWFKGKLDKDQKSTDASNDSKQKDDSNGILSRRQAAEVAQKSQKHISTKITDDMKTDSELRNRGLNIDPASSKEEQKSRSLPAEGRRNRLGEKKNDELIKGLDSLEYFEITNLGRIGANSQREPLDSTDKRKRGPVKAKHLLDTDNEYVFGTDRIDNKDILSQDPFKPIMKGVDIFADQGDILDRMQANDKREETRVNSDDEFEINRLEVNQTHTYESLIEDFENCDFWIPKMPIGKTLVFNIISTWGDNHYVGLSGIEVFDNEGNLVKLNPEDIMANPPDINILPGYTNDPRTVDKLVDKHCFTRDDLHVWLAPFARGQEHTIQIDLPRFTTISMIRIWNYNKSRVHTFRGVRLLKITLDDLPIFKGEILKAPGMLTNPAQ